MHAQSTTNKMDELPVVACIFLSSNSRKLISK